MKVAVLVLAYRYPVGLRGLSRYFCEPCFDLYVHVDAKIDVAPFEAQAGQSTCFLQERVAVYWRGWSIVEATMRLVIHAKSRCEYDRYVLISDDSVPIVNAATLRSSLAAYPDQLHIFLAHDRAWRYDKFFMFDSAATQLRWIADREVTDDALGKFERLAALRRRGKKPIAEHYQGSQWWALSAQSIEQVLASWSNDEWLRVSFEFSDAPDEGYFHAILAQACKERSRSVMWVDWAPPTPPPPRILRTYEELAEIPRSTELFARKIDLEQADLDSWMARLM